MADVFLSYATEDAEVVARLREALVGRGREVWVDRNIELGAGIEPGEDWRVSVVEAIDRCDSFVFLLSEASLASPACREELDHALDVNKRVLPVCLSEPASGTDVPEALQRLSWIMLRPGDDFDAGVERLVHALETDIEMVRQHTRILVRAKAWELGGRRASPLLRGDELRAAEDWLSRAASAGAPPTELQRQFIVASRRAATRRQRRAVGISSSVAVVAIALSVFAFLQREQARHQARLAESRQLAVSARALLSSDPEQSISLAAQGVRRAATPQAMHALRDALQTSRLRTLLRGPSGVESVAFSPSGKTLAVGSDDGTVRLWRVSDRSLLWTEGRGGPPVASLSFSGAGDVLVVVRARTDHTNLGAPTTKRCSVEVVAVSGGHVEHPVPFPAMSGCPVAAAFYGQTRYVDVLSEKGAIQDWNVDSVRPTGRPYIILPSDEVPAQGIAISPRGDQLAVIGLHVIDVIDTRTGKRTATIDTSPTGLFNPNAAAFSPDGRSLLITGEYGAEVHYLGSSTVTELPSENAGAGSAAWSGDARLLAATADKGVAVWSSGTRVVEVLAGSSLQGFRSIAFSHGLLAGGEVDGSVRIWAADPDAADTVQDAGVSLSRHQTVLPAKTAGTLAVAGDASSGLTVVDDRNRRIATLAPHGDGAFATAAGSGDVAFTRHGRLEVWHLPSGHPVRSWGLRSKVAPNAIAISADGGRADLLTADFPHATLTAVPSQRTRSVRSGDAFEQPISIRADGRLIAVPQPSGIEIYDAATLKEVRVEPGVRAGFAPTGTLIAIQRADLSIAIVDTTDWRLGTVIIGDPVAAYFLAFSPDNRLLATTGEDGVLRVYDTTDGTLVATRYLFESSHQAGQLGVSPVAMTDAGFALFDSAPGYDAAPGISGFKICDGCFDPGTLLQEADARLALIRPVKAPR